MGHSTATADDVVKAAGGVVWRRNGDRLEIALIHRPAYDDWTFPKGKLLPGEGEKRGALREVQEETGLRCRVQDPIGQSRYRDRRGRPKVVTYWLMRPVRGQGGKFHPTKEVDEVRWVSVPKASDLLTYDRDRDLLASLDLSGELPSA